MIQDLVKNFPEKCASFIGSYDPLVSFCCIVTLICRTITLQATFSDLFSINYNYNITINHDKIQGLIVKIEQQINKAINKFIIDVKKANNSTYTLEHQKTNNIFTTFNQKPHIQFIMEVFYSLITERNVDLMKLMAYYPEDIKDILKEIVTNTSIEFQKLKQETIKVEIKQEETKSEENKEKDTKIENVTTDIYTKKTQKKKHR